MAKKKILTVVKIQIEAGKASPAPPVGTALGPHGIAFSRLDILLITLAVDAQTGLLSHTGQSLSCRSPVCLVFRTI